jgi:hypothetical protein
MARRLSNGISGKNVLGSIVAVNNSLRSVVDNANVLLQPNGTGISVSVTDLQVNSANSLRLADSDSSNFIGLRAPATVAANVTLTFPNTAGSSSQVLTTDGSGILSWNNTALTITNRSAADNNTYFIAMADSSSGTEDTLSVASGRLEFVPNPGRLSAAEMRVTASTTSSSGTTGALVVTGGVGVGGLVRLGSNTASTTTATGALVVTGGMGVGGQVTATTIVETSSIALKENINPIQNALDSILKLKGVTYDRLDNNEHESGLIAEWTEEVLPELVTRDENGAVVGIKYTKLTAYLIEAVKSLKLQVDELKTNG